MDSLTKYGAVFADVYDDWYGSSDDIDAVLSVLCERRPRRVLELGVGTGRIAIPLATRLSTLAGARVVGLDESPEMLQRLAAKDEHHLVVGLNGDMVDDQPDEEFDLVFVSYNTLFNLPDRDRQRLCIAGVARRLATHGVLVVDACVIDEGVPADGATTDRRGQWTLRTTSSFDARTGLVVGLIESRHDDGHEVSRPFRIAYSAPGMIDDMCAAAGLLLERRFCSWQRDDFDDHSARHVSIYRLVR